MLGIHLGLDDNGIDRATVLREGTTQLGAASFNNRGLPTQMAWTALAASANTRSYGYDNASRLSAIGFDLNGTVGDVTWGYTRNPASQILSESQSNDSYAWDGHVNLTRAYTTNGLNQYESAGSAAFCYDANGNLTADGSSVYRYDVENRLVEKRAQGTGNTNCAALLYSGASQAVLLYDPTGRLYQVSVGSTVSQRFAYDGNAMIGEYNASGTMLRRYVHGSNAEADDPLIWYEGATQTATLRRYLHGDPRGSIVAVTDHTGNRIAVNSYDEYGIPDTATGNDIATKGRFRYTGQAWIPELGMYYYKARIYSPTLGRFLQTDPIGYEDQYNLYAYVANDPINSVDPTGMCETQAGSRICRNEGTTLVKSVTIPLRDENGNSNSSIAAKATKDYTDEAVDRTEESEFTREHGVTLSVDEKAQAYVISLFQGPKRGFFGGGPLNIVPTDRKILYSVHTHTGVGVQGEGSPFTTIRNAMRGRISIESGPSSTGRVNDLISAENWRRSNNPNARFGVYYQTVAPDGRLQWVYKGY